MKLSIGMAHYDDFDGLYFTIQSLKLHHDLEDCELIVVDNNPGSRHGAEAKKLIEHKSGNLKTRYIPFHASKGTTQTRQAIFDNAEGEAVLVMDCHVLLAPGAINALMQYYEDHPGCKDLLSGPLVTDDIGSYMTHFDLQWRGQMWGTWGTAWTTHHAKYFSFREREGKVAVHDLVTGEFKFITDHAWAGHEQVMDGNGYSRINPIRNSSAFEIPAQGLGLFSCRKDAWLGFNPHFRGFGGEEGYIHEKFRQAGARAMCLPRLVWNHRFGRVNGVPYPLSQFNKVRNYILGFQELGKDLTEVHQHFVVEHGFKQETWDRLVNDPYTFFDPNTEGVQVSVPVQTNPIEQLYVEYKNRPRDLDKHFDKLRELAAVCDHVTEITKRKESSIPFLAARPKQLVTFQEERDPLNQHLKDVAIDEGVMWKHNEVQLHGMPEIEKTDLLFIDTSHNYDRLSRELRMYGPKVNRYIVMHDTHIYGVKGDDGQAGLLPAIKDWFIENPEWFIVYHTAEQFGLTVLGRNPEDRPAQKIHAWPPGFGPGTELKEILASLGINPAPGCDCNAKAMQMDVWGVKGCKINKQTIVDGILENKDKWGWGAFASAAAKAVTSGLALRINPLKPYESLVDEAIRRAEVKGYE